MLQGGQLHDVRPVGHLAHTKRGFALGVEAPGRVVAQRRHRFARRRATVHQRDAVQPEAAEFGQQGDLFFARGGAGRVHAGGV